MAAEKKNKFRGNDIAEALVASEEQAIERNSIEDVPEKKNSERKNKPKSTPKAADARPAAEPKPAAPANKK